MKCTLRFQWVSLTPEQKHFLITLRNLKECISDTNSREQNWMHRCLKNNTQDLETAGPFFQTHYLDLPGGSQHISDTSFLTWESCPLPPAAPARTKNTQEADAFVPLHFYTVCFQLWPHHPCLITAPSTSSNKTQSLTNSQERLTAALLCSQQTLPLLSHFRDTAPEQKVPQQDSKAHFSLCTWT